MNEKRKHKVEREGYRGKGKKVKEYISVGKKIN